MATTKAADRANHGLEFREVPASISVIGAGGGGCNTMSRMMKNEHNNGGMEEMVNLLDSLFDKGWTYAAISHEVGVRWDTVKTWRLAQHPPRAYQAVLKVLQLLAAGEPPPKRRHGPDAPQHRPRE